MTSPKDLVPVVAEASERRPDEREYPQVGLWYWVSEENYEGAKFKWLGCVVYVGSNYARLRGPSDHPNSYNSERVHLNEFADRCRLESEASAVITRKISEQRKIISDTVLLIGSMMSRLQLDDASEGTKELATYRGDTMERYGLELAHAKAEGLPALKSQIEKASEAMKTWMQAEAIPMAASMQVHADALAKVEKRIGGVELYAGLVEVCVKIRDGAPAAPDVPICLWQRRHYMDEECLANYHTGGMSFENLEDFERWLTEGENLERILPEPRSAVAFRVRRERKEDYEGGLDVFIKMMFAGRDENMQTYLYLRNGEQVWRLSTNLDFGEKLFPDLDHQLLKGDRVYAIRPWSNVERLATEGEYLDTVQKEKDLEIALAALPEAATAHERWRLESSYRTRYRSNEYILWDRSSVYFDDITNYVQQLATDHNRLVLVLQGLLDRSAAFSPHPPYKLWVPADFERAVRLIFDDSRALPAAELPDFEAYREKCNASLHPGSLVVGQEEAWLLREAARYNLKIDREFRGDAREYAKRQRYRPDGNPGPGVVARATSVSARGCTFVWKRRKVTNRYGDLGDKVIGDKITVPPSQLLCVDAYRPGDYKRFYADPRTRAEYLQWAPLLLRAEEWHAGLHR